MTTAQEWAVITAMWNMIGIGLYAVLKGIQIIRMVVGV